MENSPEKCILCDSREREPLIEMDGWRVFRCLGCDLGFLDPRPTKEEAAALYDQEYFADQYDRGIDPGTAAFHKRLRQESHRVRFFKNIKPAGRLLDIGCGNGYFLAACRQKGYDVRGTDVSEWAAAYAAEKLKIPVIRGEVDQLDLAPGSFDIITMWHFLEHTRNPRDVVTRVRTWLAEDGILVVDVPNYGGTDARKEWEKWVGWQLPYHFYHFKFQPLKRLITDCGFRLIKSKDYHSETVKTALKKVPLLGLFARPIAKFYSGTSVAVVAGRDDRAG